MCMYNIKYKNQLNVKKEEKEKKRWKSDVRANRESSTETGQ